jgi:hypothetical protein
MASHLAAATLIVIFKDYVIRARKIKTGWSHSTQRQLQQAAVSQLPPPPTILPHRNAPPPLQMSPPPIPPTYIYPSPPMMYNPYLPTYPIMQHPSNGTSTPRSTTSGAATPSTLNKETPSPR